MRRMGNRRDVIGGRIRALPNQAADRAGTPEGELFEAKVLELLARQGLTEGELPGAHGPDPRGIVERTIDVTGRYVPQRLGLLGALAAALHHACATRTLGSTGRRAIVVGTRRHADGLDLLWPILDAHMAQRAVGLRSATGNAAETARLRRSFMVGFARDVAARLRGVEHAVAEEHSPGAGLAVRDDAHRAAEEMARRHHVRARRTNTADIDPSALGEGLLAARAVDLGARRMSRHRAIGAQAPSAGPSADPSAGSFAAS